jgi:hypothetical protein
LHRVDPLALKAPDGAQWRDWMMLRQDVLEQRDRERERRLRGTKAMANEVREMIRSVCSQLDVIAGDELGGAAIQGRLRILTFAITSLRSATHLTGRPRRRAAKAASAYSR